MNGFHEKNGRLFVEHCDLQDIATQFGTPTYVYSAEGIREQYQKLSHTMQRILPKDRQPLLCYACKANSHIAVLSLLKNMGCGLEIVSEGELIRGLKAGFEPQQIVSTGVGKTQNEIKALLQTGIHQINVESLEEMRRVNEIAHSLNKVADIVFRLNPNVSGGGHDKISTGRKGDKFGISEQQVHQGFQDAENLSNINAIGLSVHIGSQVFDVSAFREAFAKLPELVHDLRAKNYTISRLDIGGGFPIQYKDEQLLDLSSYAEWVRDIIVPLDTEIIMEPGRYLVGNAGMLLTRIEYIKKTEEHTFIVLDTGMSELVRPAMYDAYHAIEPIENRDAPHDTPYDIVGPICESSDRFLTSHNLPAMKQGDLMAIRSAGAYGASMSSNYNTRGRPAEILVQGDEFSIITPRQSYEDIIKHETIPGWIQNA